MTKQEYGFVVIEVNHTIRMLPGTAILEDVIRRIGAEVLALVQSRVRHKRGPDDQLVTYRGWVQKLCNELGMLRPADAAMYIEILMKLALIRVHSVEFGEPSDSKNVESALAYPGWE
jgi:hypothetical protein